MRLSVTLAACSILSACSVWGWGAIGYETFLNPKILSFSEFLGAAAPWADDVRSEAAFSWSAPFHFVDAEDNPPTSCSVEQMRDCSSGERHVVSAIANYTTRVFIGDIGQPLHVQAVEVGGNDINAVCNGETSAKHVWDSGIINIFLKAQYCNSVIVWANALAQRTQTGDLKSLTSTWLSCFSTTESVNNRHRSIEDNINGLVSDATITLLECPLSFVFSYTGFSDLCTSSYATGAQPIIEEQIAKQGYRLAA
ncbi:nuclease Le1 [Lentinula edodes]|nr:nuclease Le1 [Lentinula edodes]